MRWLRAWTTRSFPLRLRRAEDRLKLQGIAVHRPQPLLMSFLTAWLGGWDTIPTPHRLRNVEGRVQYQGKGSPATTYDLDWPNKMAASMGLSPKATPTGKGKASHRGSRQGTPVGQTRAATHKKEHTEKKATARKRKISGGGVI